MKLRLRRLSRFLLPSLIAVTAALANPPADGTVIPLWPEGVPGQLGILADEQWEDGRVRNVQEPTLTYCTPAVDRPTRTAVIVCPGGGYTVLSFEREGWQYARWLSQQGITTFILKNRLKEYGHPHPLRDVLRAIRHVRDNAAAYGIDPDRIGVMGSSAGGHLAASASTLFDHPDGKTGAAIDAVSARPDFAILMYPVISMADGVTHEGSRRNITHEDPALRPLLSLEDQVTAATPPTLIIHTQDDQSVPVANALRYYTALSEAGVPAELYIFQHGPHGMGLKPGLGTASSWPDRAREWLQDRGLTLR
ncbi:alpha/beta hydrolase [Actomonas aquatica]|uniref:Alpha/beta hydrolase n=1 Tax=Actomonas aquatica TaxID=2866162 RepID=A0ABZ1CEV2_9BACT|nr:alpha/beta hydrolase [Opitutus sp. WL0086]WRQ89942.1 alpha/beta hydrolase [Opitutus sp. WL0086]